MFALLSTNVPVSHVAFLQNELTTLVQCIKALPYHFLVLVSRRADGWQGKRRNDRCKKSVIKWKPERSSCVLFRADKLSGSVASGDSPKK